VPAGRSAGRAYAGAVLEDGTYDVVVVDASDGADGAVALELTVLGGAHRGEMVNVTASGLGRDPLDLLAVPGTLVVADGRPEVSLEG
jgi:hypothetical protein